MTKQDIIEEGLPPVPKKRRALKQALDIHIAMWLDSDDLTPSERRRVQEEKDERKHANPDNRVGLIIGQEGVTPEQLSVLRAQLAASGATEVHHPGVSSKLHGACKVLDVPVVVHYDVRNADTGNTEIVRLADKLFAAPKDEHSPSGPKQGIWAVIKYAKHRKVPMKVILPNGDIQAD